MTYYAQQIQWPLMGDGTNSGRTAFRVNEAVNTSRIRNIFNQAIEKQLKELNMTIDKNRIEIDPKDIRAGDKIRKETRNSDEAREYRVDIAGGHCDITKYRYLLLDRPKKIKWAKGTTLWFTDNNVAERWGKYGVTVQRDCYEGDEKVLTSVDIHAFYVHRFTDIKPEPHPVGATRWVTEDHLSAYGVRICKGFKVTVAGHEKHGDYDLSIKWIDQNAVFSKSKFLSATPVEPEPVFVSVRKDALDKLRAGWGGCESTIGDFLATVVE